MKLKQSKISRTEREEVVVPEVVRMISSEERGAHYTDAGIAAKVNERRASGDVNLSRDITGRDVLNARNVASANGLISSKRRNRAGMTIKRN